MSGKTRGTPDRGRNGRRGSESQGPILAAVTKGGRRVARSIWERLGSGEIWNGSLEDAVAASFKTSRPLVAVAAVGAVVRLAAPWLTTKTADPAVVCVDESARYVVPVLGGHEAGANSLAERVARIIEAQPVVTTASESMGGGFLRALQVAGNFVVDQDRGLTAAALETAYLDRIPIFLHSRIRWPIGPLAPNVEFRPLSDAVPKGEQPCGERGIGDHVHVAVTAADPPPAFGCGAPTAVVRPPELVLGVGFSTDASRAEVELVARDVLRRAGLSPLAVATAATIEHKEPALGRELSVDGRKLPVTYVSAEDLASVEVASPSESVRAAVGVPSVAEAAALWVASRSGKNVRLVVEKTKTQRVTAAVARIDPKGVLGLVSLGPGSESLVTPAAARFLGEASHVIGLDIYVERAEPYCHRFASLEKYPIGSEDERADSALRLAASGRRVAVVSGGDVGIYGMASRTVTGRNDDFDLVVIPGVSALQAAASVLGAPLGDDFACVSLSDYDTSWDAIATRLKAAASSGMVLCLFNPSSSKRPGATRRAASILLEVLPPHTPVGIVENAYREGQRVEICDLATLSEKSPGMASLVVVGGAGTSVEGSYMVTRRKPWKPRH